MKARDEDAGTLFLNTPTNPVTGMMRWVRATDKFEEYSGSAWVAQLISVAGGGTGAATAADARTNLGLGTLAVQNSNAVSISGGTISGLSTLGVSGTVTAGLFSGSGASLTSIPNSATTATNLNTPSAIVARDASGNFSAGTITANVTGNAGTVTNGVVTSGSYSDPAWITALSASKLTSGALPDARLSANVAMRNAANTFTGVQTCTVQPAGRIHRTSAYSISDSTLTSIAFDTSAYNPSPAIAAINDLISCYLYNGGVGIYLVTAQVTWAPGGGTIRRLKIVSDAVGDLAGSESVPHPSQYTTNVVSVIVPVSNASTGHLRVRVFQDSGSNLNVEGFDGGSSWISAVKLW